MPNRNRNSKSAFSSISYQALEPRQLLANATLDGGLLTIGGTGNDDVVALRQSSDNGPIYVVDNGAISEQFAAQDVEHIAFYGMEGNDTFFLLGNAFSSGSGFSLNSTFENLISIKFVGGNGDDLFIARFGDYGSIDLMANGGDGNDRLIANSLDGLASSGSGDALTKLRFYGGNGVDYLLSTGIAIGNTRLIGGDDADTIVGGNADDVVRGGSGNDSVQGGGGNDLLVGDEGNDSLAGGDGHDRLMDNFGNDHLSGGSGNDWIFGGAGEDLINGDTGNDRLLGGDDADSIFGHDGSDYVSGGRGNDTISGGRGNDHLVGFDGNDMLHGDNGNDKLFGGAGLDDLFGDDGDDLMVGGLGDDTLVGAAGDDLLFGTEDDDSLDGGIGTDYLDGGSDNDHLVGGVDTNADTLKGSAGRDNFVPHTNDDRLVDFDFLEDEKPSTQDLTDGTTTLIDRNDFNILSHRDDFPGALNVQEVKILITNVDSGSPTLHFINTNNHPFHYGFWRNALGNTAGNGAFNSQTYFTNSGRVNVAGSLVAHDNYVDDQGQRGGYTLEFWPTDPMAFEFVNLAFNMVTAAAPWLSNQLHFHPSSETMREAVANQQAEYDSSNIRIIDTDDLFGNLDYQPMNQAESFGRLVLADGSTTLTARDIPIFSSLPNDLSTVSGIITEVPQTPLSHVNLKAKQNNTPNAYIKDATTDPRLTNLLDQLVYLNVGPTGFEIRAATQAEVDTFFESIRPTDPQSPTRDLTVTEILPLDSISFSDTDVFGSKAANVAELQQLMPTAAPDGFAIPFSFYDAYMQHNGFYAEAQAMIADPNFQTDAEFREDALKAFRKRIKKNGVMPTWINDRLTVLQNSFPSDVTPRLRSSSNAEDLVGFNGAGLYSSFTHHDDEGHISKSVKQVWASLWNYRAYEEREFYRVDHFEAAMGVLVHPNFEAEQSNGVAVSKNIFDPRWLGYYVNVQVGEDLVTNPNVASIPEEMLIANLAGSQRYETQYIRSSNQLAVGERVLSQAHIFELADRLAEINNHFAPLYGTTSFDPEFAMEIEFKITADGELSIKQARPWAF